MKKYFIALVAIVLIALVARSTYEMGRHGVSVSSTPVTKTSYVALGDSVAAGIGLQNYSDSSACNRTNESYPNLVAQARNYNLTNLACTGATLPEGILGAQNVNNLAVAPQLDKLFALPRPEVISVTIGANDAGWTSLLAKCYTSTCGSEADTATVDARLTAVTSHLTTMLTRIRDHYGATIPKAVVTGYYQLLPAIIGSCPDATGIDQSEVTWARARQESIISVLKTVTGQFSFATFAPIDFTGHELCSANSWEQGISDKAPYHPTADGQAAIARAVESSITMGK